MNHRLNHVIIQIFFDFTISFHELSENDLYAAGSKIRCEVICVWSFVESFESIYKIEICMVPKPKGAIISRRNGSEKSGFIAKPFVGSTMVV